MTRPRIRLATGMAALIVGAGIASAAPAMAAAVGAGQLTDSSPVADSTLTPATIAGSTGDVYTVTATLTPKLSVNGVVSFLFTKTADTPPASSFQAPTGGSCTDLGSYIQCGGPPGSATMVGTTFTASFPVTVPAGTGTVGSYELNSTYGTHNALTGSISNASGPVMDPLIGLGTLGAIAAGGAAFVSVRRRRANLVAA